MKKSILFIFSLIYSASFFSQTANPSVDFSEGNGNPLDRELYSVKKGDLIINPWYGLGTINIFPGNDTLENFKSLYLRPMGVCAEYMFTD